MANNFMLIYHSFPHSHSLSLSLSICLSLSLSSLLSPIPYHAARAKQHGRREHTGQQRQIVNETRIALDRERPPVRRGAARQLADQPTAGAIAAIVVVNVSIAAATAAIAMIVLIAIQVAAGTV